MLSRSQRLYTSQFNIVIAKGKVFHSSLFSLRSLPVQGETRVSVVALKKIARKAHDRVAIRRIVYRLIQAFFKDLKGGYHVIIFVQKPLDKIDEATILAEIKSLFVKAGLMK